jgi:hypothetical protein
MVKFANKTSVSRLDATRRALFLVYGCEEPSVTDPPPKLLTHVAAAKLMRVKPFFVSHLLTRYFKP